jgi:acetyl esterase/lipase
MNTLMKSFQRPLLVCFLVLASGALAQDIPATGRGEPSGINTVPVARKWIPPLVNAAEKIERDVVYGQAGGVDLKLDIYHPKRPVGGAQPVAVYVHGGGWTKGDKSLGAGMLALPELLKRGYLVVAINYRLAPEFKFPAQIEDVKCAIRYLRAHAGELNLDPQRIGVWGGSAGGHLVALLGTTDESARFDTSGGWTNQSSRVQAVVDMFGPTDLTLAASRGLSNVGQNVFGAKSAADPILKRASPVAYVSKDDPSFLFLHGDHDLLVPLRQSQILHERLTAAGVPSTLVVVTNAAHGFAPAGGDPRPTRVELAKMIADFFDRTLGGRPASDRKDTPPSHL